jgi:hypothetical protein
MASTVAISIQFLQSASSRRRGRACVMLGFVRSIVNRRRNGAPGSSFSSGFGLSSIRRAHAIPGPPGSARGFRTSEKRGRARSVVGPTHEPHRHLAQNLPHPSYLSRRRHHPAGLFPRFRRPSFSTCLYSAALRPAGEGWCVMCGEPSSSGGVTPGRSGPAAGGAAATAAFSTRRCTHSLVSLPMVNARFKEKIDKK